MQLENGEDGSLVLYNTDGQYPAAFYDLASPLTVLDPATAKLSYDFTVDTGSSTNIILFFKIPLQKPLTRVSISSCPVISMVSMSIRAAAISSVTATPSRVSWI